MPCLYGFTALICILYSKIKEILIVPYRIIVHPANGVGSNSFNGLGFDVECIGVG